MNSKVYKSCAVSLCNNTTKKTPKKLFVYVPNNKKMRFMWLKIARRDPTTFTINSPIYFCEDHFDLPVDMANYMEYHVMGTVSQVRMNPGCIPTKFECQPDRRKRTSNTITIPHILKKKRKILIEECEDQSPHRDSSSPTISPISTSDCSELLEYDGTLESTNFLEHTLQTITKNPRFYLGIPKTCFFLLDLIEGNTKIPQNHILLCLKKIKLNNTFRELANDFSLTPTCAKKIFFKNVPVIARLMHPFIVKLDKKLTGHNLAKTYRHKYCNVTCLVDCFEIEIEKPVTVLNQSHSWSKYKKANTIKYLISCTPNGLVNYISPGFGGRIPDTYLVELCDFKEYLQTGMYVMADTGFRNVEQHLWKQGVQLVCPPSDSTEGEAKEMKEIAHLRICIEGVIRRLRQFNMLGPSACINHNLVKVLDDVITISCGLINLQDSLME